MTPLLAQAQQYVRRGWSVIPILPRGKTPAIDSWKEFQTRRPTDDELAEWFDGARGDRNIAVVTGVVSGLVVVDLDGAEGLGQLQRPELRTPLSSSTGHGRHLFFAHPGGAVKNAVRTLPGTDLRADGGYVLVAPSVHPSGRRYQWQGALTALLPPLAAFLLAEVAPKARNASGWVTEALKEMAPGNIDNTLFKVCARLRRDGYSKDEAMVLLAPHAAAAGATPGHLPDKINHVWGTYPAATGAQVAARPLTGVSFSDVVNTDAVVRWVAHPYIPEGGITFLVGMQGLGKTWVTLDLAVALASNSKWLGALPSAPNKRVLYIDDESSRDLLAARLRLIQNGRLVNEDRLKFVVKPDLDVRSPAGQKSLEDAITNFQADVVIFDSYSCFHIGDDNSSEHTMAMMKIFKDIVNRLHCTLVVIDHVSTSATFREPGKALPSSNDVAGSKVKVRQADSVVNLMAEKGLLVLYHTKARHSATSLPVILELRTSADSVAPTIVTQ